MNILFIFKHQTKPYYHHLPIFLFIIIFLSPPYSLVEAQRINSDWDSNPFYTAGVVLVTFAVLSFLVYLLIYLFYKRFVQRWAARSHDHRVHAGLDPSILRTFPVFVYSTMTGLKPNKGSGPIPGSGLGPAECAICLGMFERDETLRLLPKCGHVFHVDCVDPWLAGHTTCPLCRANLVSEPGELTRVESGCIAELGCEEGGVNEVENDAVEVRQEIEGVQSRNFSRWNSTGHVARFEGLEEDEEKSTTVRKDNVTRELNRSKSCIIITLELGC